MPKRTSAPDTQSEWDAETLCDFRRKLKLLVAKVRDCQQDEATTLEALTDCRERTKGAQRELSECIDFPPDDEADLDPDSAAPARTRGGRSTGR